MIRTTKLTDIPFDGANYQLIEFEDIFYISTQKKVKIKDFGKKVASTNAFFFDYLKEYHIPTSFHLKDSDNSLKFQSSKEYPFRIKILNCADKRNAKIFKLKEGSELNLPIQEFHFGYEKESVVCESHLISFDLCSVEDLKLISRICSKINAVLKSFFERRNEIMAEISLYFGKIGDKVFLIGDFSPSSLKIFPKDETTKWINPYKLNKTSEVKKYTDHLFSIASVK
jgi:phosphoribosylaminoimidazole-succinocarboxamide synthase